MKYRTAAAIAICLTHGAIAAPTQSNEQAVAKHKNPHGQPPQLVENNPERRDRDVNTAELSEMIQNALSGAGRQSRQKRGDIGEGAVKALEQTARFTQTDGQEETGLDLKVNLGRLTDSLRDKRSEAKMLPVRSPQKSNDDSSGSGNTIKQLIKGAGLGDVLTDSGLSSVTNGANLEEVTDVTGLTSKTGAGSLGELATGINKLKARREQDEQNSEEDKPKDEAKKPSGSTPSKAEKKRLLENILKKLGIIDAAGKLNLDKALNKLHVSDLTDELKVNKLTDSLGATELTNKLGVTGGKNKGKAPTADKAKFTVSARSFQDHRKKPAAE